MTTKSNKHRVACLVQSQLKPTEQPPIGLVGSVNQTLGGGTKATQSNEQDGIPTIQARRITRADGVELLAFKCPECGRIATHGLPKGCTLPTHRLAHCPCYQRGYYITTTEGGAQ